MLRSDFPPSELVVPAVFLERSGPRVLTMEWVDGCRIDDAAALKAQKADLRRIAHRLPRIFAQMTFVQGFVHCDPVRPLRTRMRTCARSRSRRRP